MKEVDFSVKSSLFGVVGGDKRDTPACASVFAVFARLLLRKKRRIRGEKPRVRTAQRFSHRIIRRQQKTTA